MNLITSSTSTLTPADTAMSPSCRQVSIHGGRIYSSPCQQTLSPESKACAISDEPFDNDREKPAKSIIIKTASIPDMEAHIFSFFNSKNLVQLQREFAAEDVSALAPSEIVMNRNLVKALQAGIFRAKLDMLAATKNCVLAGLMKIESSSQQHADVAGACYAEKPLKYAKEIAAIKAIDKNEVFKWPAFSDSARSVSDAEAKLCIEIAKICGIHDLPEFKAQLSQKEQELISIKEILLVLITFEAYFLSFAPLELRANTEFMLAVVKRNGMALCDAPAWLQDDETIVAAAVAQNGRALRFASERLRDNFEIGLKAVMQNGFALDLVSERLRDNEELVLAAVRQNKYSLDSASQRLQKDSYLLAAGG